MSKRPSVVILGGGFAGMQAARRLRKAEANVVLIDRRNHHLFQPLLYQVATAALSPANIASPIRKIFRKQSNLEVRLDEVRSIDLEKRSLSLAEGSLDYDYLVIAVGAVNNYFGNESWPQHAPGLKTVEEALDIRRRFLLALEEAEREDDPEKRRERLTFAIVGGGPTGVEMAGAIAEMSRKTLPGDFRHIDTSTVKIILMDALPRLLPTFPEELSARTKKDLEAMEVDVRLDTMVKSIESGRLTVEKDDETYEIQAANCIWAAGVRTPRVIQGLEVEKDKGGRIQVQPDLTIEDHPEVFVAGDCANCTDPKTGDPVPGMAPGAIQMGKYAGKRIAEEIAASARGDAKPERKPFRYTDKGMMATIGRNRAVADIRGFRFGGFFAFLLWSFVHLYFLVGFRNRIATFAEWIWLYFFHDRGARLITAPGRRGPDE